MPLLFLVIGYLLIYLLAHPVLVPVQSVLSMVIGQEVPRFEEDDAEQVVNLADANEQQNKVDINQVVFPDIGDKFARITISGTEVDCDLYYGDTKAILKKGAGQYTGSKLPGFGSTTMVAAHVTTHFKDLKNVEPGDVVTVTTTYGVYTYTIESTAIKNYQDETAYDLRAKEDNLVLYTCYPFDSFTFTAQRFFVYAKYTSGPEVIYR